jgi:hypothetical protein
MVEAGEERDVGLYCIAVYRLAYKSDKLKHSLALTGIFRFKPASQFVERYHSDFGLCTEHGGSHFE